MRSFAKSQKTPDCSKTTFRHRKDISMRTDQNWKGNGRIIVGFLFQYSPNGGQIVAAIMHAMLYTDFLHLVFPS